MFNEPKLCTILVDVDNKLLSYAKTAVISKRGLVTCIVRV